MNMYYPQVHKRSQLVSYLLAAFAICTALMLVLRFNGPLGHRWSLPSGSSVVVSSENAGMPLAIPAPIPPAEQVQVSVTALSESANSVPQAVPAPVPSVQ